MLHNPHDTAALNSCFNPHPPTWAGATMDFNHFAGTLTVSILTRPRGRVLLLKMRPTWHRVSFNPHPPTWAGATKDNYAMRSILSVSILTRPRGRVLHEIHALADNTYGFQSSPAHVGGCYCLIYARVGLSNKFQSSPAHVGGCYLLHLRCRRPGERVSILTRPRGRVLHSGACEHDL